MNYLPLIITIVLLIALTGCDKDDPVSPDNNTVTDIDGNVYSIIQIGDQWWMAENLRTTSYRNGDAIPTNLDNTQWLNTTSGAYAIYPHDDVEGINSDAEMVLVYGRLYNWYAVNDSRGLCPQGWHAPSREDWTILVNYLGGQGYPNTDEADGAGNALKSRRQVNSPLGEPWATSEHPRWNPDDTHFGLDVFGFSGLPGGFRWCVNGDYYYVGSYGYFWSSTEYNFDLAWLLGLLHWYGDGHIGYLRKHDGYSVRCLR